MRILTFSAYYTPEIAASMYLTEDMLEGMAKAGHYVDLYVPMPCRGISDEIRKEYKKKKIEVLYDGHLIIHRFSLYREGKNTLLRALRYAFLILGFAWHGLWKKTDVIFAQSTPPIQGMMAGFLASVKRVPFVYNLQDIFPDSLVNTGMTHEGSGIWKIGRFVENFGYKRTSKFIVISEDFKKNIMAKGVPENKIVVVPNWADVRGVYPIERKENKLIKKYNLDPKKFYITYSGNIGYTQNIDMLLDVAKEIKKEFPEIKFVLIGDGVAKSDVEKRVKEENIENVIMLPFQPYEDIAHVFSLGDAGLIISKPGVGSNSVPSKTWSIMAAERPILASFDKDSNLCRLIEEVGCGLKADAGDKDGFRNNIKKLYKENLSDMGAKGGAYIRRNFSKDGCVAKYIGIIETAKRKRL